VVPGLAAIANWGKTITGTELAIAQEYGHYLNLKLIEIFHQARVLVLPTVAGQLPESGGVGTINGQGDMNWVKFTYPFNQTRSPVATVTVGFTSDGMPVGLQIVGPQHGDQVVLRTAAALEEAIGIESIAPRLA
ncbi:MAG: amidase, partial [Acidimicrobiales bacterium]|nr:amidase [Acidimicrobiales bacterium]